MSIVREDASGYRGEADALFAPADERELIEIVRRGGPITIAGAGTGVTGGSVPQGGVVVSMERFTRFEIADGSAWAGAGVSLAALQAAAAKTGQFFGPDPTEWTASIGGAIATNASGARSFLYGDMRRHVLALRVVLADGSAAEFRRGQSIGFDVPAIPLPHTTKNTAGYRLAPGMDWVDLFTGAEGTLGIVTEAELRLLPSPKHLLTGVVFFADDGRALDAVDEWRAIDGLRMIEYCDTNSLALLQAPAAAALIVEQENGDAGEWIERVERARGLLDESWFGTSAQDREQFRRFRHALPERVNDVVRRRGFQKIGSDYAVPIERNCEMIAFYKAAIRQDHVIFGHIGDAHLHVNILPNTAEEAERGRALMIEFAHKAVELGGTVSAEHGLGKRKRNLLAIQYTPEQIEAMKAVKRRLDPGGILNPGNLFDMSLPHGRGSV
jgi:FAD/FMN-containing dehydrogenase